MTETASLELCRELYKLSGWDDMRLAYGTDGMVPLTIVGDGFRPDYDEAPAYTLSYLLRKLPKSFDGYYFDLSVTETGWVAEYFTNDYTDKRPISKYKTEADNPTDAACKLAIELFKQGILTKEAQDG